MTHLPHRVVLALLITMSACGGGLSYGDRAEESAAPVDSAVTDVGTADESTAAWCGLAHSVDEAGARLDDADLADAVAVQAAFDEMSEKMRAASPVAPDEIADAVELSLDGFEKLRLSLAAAAWDFVSADLSRVDEMSADLEAADAEIDAYNERVCATFIDGDDTEAAAVPGNASISDQVVIALVDEGFSASEARCVVDNIDFADPNAASDANQVAPVFETCGIDLARLDDLGG